MVLYFCEQMLVKIWSVDRKVKKLVGVNDFQDLKTKAVDEGVCHCRIDSNLKASVKKKLRMWQITPLTFQFIGLPGGWN